MKIYDIFLYNGEENMLEFRLNELNEVVHRFIICESSYTFQGNKKELTYSKLASKLERFKDKITYCLCDELHSTTNPWHNEWQQRRYVKQAIINEKLNDEDIVLVSDVDEIPDSNILRQILSYNTYTLGPRVFNMYMYYYNINCKLAGLWKGTALLNWKDLKQLDIDIQHVRNIRESLPSIADNNGVAGWHYSYFGNIDYIINKLKSFAHSEYNTEYYTDRKKIEEAIKNNKDLFHRKDAVFYKVENEEYVPKHINMLRF